MRADNAAAAPDWFNAPVPSFGSEHARLLIVGLAPGLKGANRTGRPFTGDYAGDLLYATLLDLGFASGTYDARPDDGLTLVDCLITNAVRCVPPANKPTPAEITACRPFLSARLAASPNLECVVALGRIAHDSVVKAANRRAADMPFAHGRRHQLADGLTFFDSYHCSRYNTNTGRLTPQMFRAVFADVRAHLDAGR
ncbi:MAG: uracil-DNA glycosylase [Hyphomicrobiaceae bacterium]